jgi:hypothetical protein
MSGKGAPKKDFCLRGHAISLVGRNKSGACMACYVEYHNNYREKLKLTEKYRWNMKHRVRNKAAIQKYGLKQRYGITPIVWQQMFDKQKGCCALCGKHQSQFKTILCVDHSHTTGQIRGLLCRGCNYSLGFFENKEFHSKAEKYLGGYANSTSII